MAGSGNTPVLVDLEHVFEYRLVGLHGSNYRGVIHVRPSR